MQATQQIRIFNGCSEHDMEDVQQISILRHETDTYVIKNLNITHVIRYGRYGTFIIKAYNHMNHLSSFVCHSLGEYVRIFLIRMQCPSSMHKYYFRFKIYKFQMATYNTRKKKTRFTVSCSRNKAENSVSWRVLISKG